MIWLLLATFLNLVKAIDTLNTLLEKIATDVKKGVKLGNMQLFFEREFKKLIFSWSFVF